MKKLIGKIFSIESVLVQAYVLLLLGMTMPYKLPIFTPVIFIYFTIYFITRALKGSITFRINNDILLFYLCILAYFVGMVFSEGVVYGTNVRDIKNILGLLLIAFMLGEMTEENYKKFIHIYSQIVVVVLTFSAFISAYNFFSVITGRNSGFFSIVRGKAFIGTALSGGYNMFVLGIFAGLLAACHCFSKSRTMLSKILYLISIGLMTVVIVLAGSRRGWVVLFLVILYYFLKISILNLRRITRHIGRVRIHTVGTVFSIVLVFFLSSTILFLNKDKIRVVKPRELKKITYRFDTIFSREGDLGEAFSKRTIRWDYAGDLLGGYDISQLLVGAGFDYVHEYGLQFSSAGLEDNPHNIFISATFYSGIVGLGLMIVMVAFGAVRLFEKRNLFGEQFILLFVVCLLFVTPGANSLFSVRLFPLILITIFSVRKSRTNQSTLLVV